MTRPLICLALLFAASPASAQSETPTAEPAKQQPVQPVRPPLPSASPPPQAPAAQSPWYPPPGAYTPWYPPPGAQVPWYPPPQSAPYPWYPPPQSAPYPWYPPPAAAAPTSPAVVQTPALAAEPAAAPYTGRSPTRASWALQLESAQGVGTGKFQNTLFAGHMDYAFSSRTSLGGYVALANLKGKDGRVNALLPAALVTYEKPHAPGHSVSFPIQLAGGYLTRNGPVARLAVGLAWAIGRRTDLVFDLASMAWVTRDEMLLSLNAAVELRFRAGD